MMFFSVGLKLIWSYCTTFQQNLDRGAMLNVGKWGTTTKLSTSLHSHIWHLFSLVLRSLIQIAWRVLRQVLNEKFSYTLDILLFLRALFTKLHRNIICNIYILIHSNLSILEACPNKYSFVLSNELLLTSLLLENKRFLIPSVHCKIIITFNLVWYFNVDTYSSIFIVCVSTLKYFSSYLYGDVSAWYRVVFNQNNHHKRKIQL